MSAIIGSIGHFIFDYLKTPEIDEKAWHAKLDPAARFVLECMILIEFAVLIAIAASPAFRHQGVILASIGIVDLITSSLCFYLKEIKSKRPLT